MNKIKNFATELRAKKEIQTLEEAREFHKKIKALGEKEAAELVRESQKPDYEKIYRAQGIVKRYWGVKIDEITAQSIAQEKALSVCKDFVKRFSEAKKNGTNLIFCGDVGTGKTLIASAIIQSLGKGKYIRAIDINRKITASYSTKDYTHLDVVDELVEPELLVIDEVGIQSDSEHERIAITDLIDRRYGEMNCTIVCSNHTEKEMAELFGARAWSRLTQKSVIIPITGESLRGAA